MSHTDQRKRGLAALPPERRKEIAAMGGRTAHQMGRAHEFTKEEARAAGRKGGLSKQARRKAQKGLPEEAAEFGRQAAQARQQREVRP